MTNQIFEKFKVELDENAGIHYQLEGGGLLHIERKLPFLLVYRYSEDKRDVVIENMIKNEVSWMFCPETSFSSYRNLLKKIVKKMSDEFGAFLLMEIWSEDKVYLPKNNMAGFEILGPEQLPETVIPMQNSLEKMKLAGLIPNVKTTKSENRCPQNLEPLLERKILKRYECLLL